MISIRNIYKEVKWIKREIKEFYKKRFILARIWLVTERKLRLIESFNDVKYKEVEETTKEKILNIKKEIRPYNLIFDKLLLVEKLYLYKVVIEKQFIKEFCKERKLNQYQITKIQKAIESKFI